MIVLLLAAAAISQTGQPNADGQSGRGSGGPSSRPASRPAQLEKGGTGADMTGDVTFIYELDERRFKVQESWTLNNPSRKLIEPITFEMPKGVFRLTLDEDIKAFGANDAGTKFFSKGPLGSGQQTVAGAYFLSFSGHDAVARRTVPVNMTSARLIVEDIASLTVASNVDHRCDQRDLNGLKFKVCTFDEVKAGGVFEVRFNGLPTRSTWPRTLALLCSLAFVGWMVISLTRSTTWSPSSALSPVSAVARRDQIVRALELLKEDLESERVSTKKYERRHAELMGQLADVLREIEVSKSEGAEPS